MSLVFFSFLCGMVLESRYPHWVPALPIFAATSVPAEAGEAAPVCAAEPAEGDDGPASTDLLKELAEQQGLQVRREEEIRREIREAEVALHLLRVRGHAAEDLACREQAAKARAAGAALSRLRAERAETMRLEAELRQADEEDRAHHVRPNGEADVGGRVRVYLMRRSLMRQVALPDATENKGPCPAAINDPQDD